LHGYAAKTQSLTLDIANQVVYRNLIAAEDVLINDRNPVGSVSMELDTVAAKDWYSIIRLGTLGALSLIHGSVAGRIVEAAAPKVQITDPSMSESDGVAMMSATLSLQPNTGNDELILTFR
jgi:hypothetical protein